MDTRRRQANPKYNAILCVGHHYTLNKNTCKQDMTPPTNNWRNPLPYNHFYLRGFNVYKFLLDTGILENTTKVTLNCNN